MTQYVRIYNNTSPTNTTTISDKSYNAGYPLSFSFSDTLFTDEDGEAVSSYSYTSTPDASGWLSFDSATRTFSGTPAVNNDALNYTVNVTAEDPNNNSAHGSTIFNLEIVPNSIPESDMGLYNVPTNVTVHQQYSYTVPSDAFKDKEGDAITITFSLIPNEFTMTYDSATRVVSGMLSDNTKFGNYTMHFDVTDIWNVSAFVAELNFTYFENMPPVVHTQPSNPSNLISHFPLSHSIPKSYFSEPEGETIIYSFTTNETSAKSTWLILSENSTHLLFSGTPNNTQFGNFKVILSLDDGHTDVTDTTTEFEFNVTENQSPILTGVPTTLTDGHVGFSWSYVFDKSWVSEAEAETITYRCSFTPSDPWLSCSENTTHFTFTGTPDSNSYAQEYNITVTISDPHSDVSDTVWNGPFNITANAPPIIGTLTDQSLLAPDGLTWSFGAALTSDPENLPYTNSLEFNGSTSIPSWLSYNLTEFDFAVISSSNSIKGTHNITIVATDDYNTGAKSTFFLTILENSSPQITNFINNQKIVNYNYLEIAFSPVHELFYDPDNRTMVSSMRQANGDALPSFLEYNTIENKLSGTPEVTHVGDWILSYISTDDHNLTSNITFTLSVKP